MSTQKTKLSRAISGARMPIQIYRLRIRLLYSLTTLTAYVQIYNRLRPRCLAEWIWKLSIKPRLFITKIAYSLIRKRRRGYIPTMPEVSGVKDCDSFNLARERFFINHLKNN